MNIINEIDVQIEKIQRNSQTIKEFICSQGKEDLLNALESYRQTAMKPGRENRQA